MNQTTQTYVDRIYCINLDKRTDRWEKMQQRFKKVGILDVERKSAYTHDNLPPQKYIDKMYSKTSQEFCTISHISVLQDAYDKGYKSIIVFEDDVIIHKDFNNKLVEIIEKLDNKFDLLMLDGCSLDYKMEEGVYTSKNQWLTSGYLLQRRSIKIILDTFSKSDGNKPMHKNRDIEYQLIHIQSLGNSFIMTPRLCIQEFLDSDIQDSNHVKSLKSWFERCYYPKYLHLYVQ